MLILKGDERLIHPWKLAAAAFCVALACAVAYSNSLAIPFFFDDTGSIVENPSIRSLANLSHIFWPPGEGRTVQGRPLLNFSFALNYAWTGLDVWSWHVVNIVLHALAGICLLGVARQTLLAPTIPPAQRQRATPLAFAIALLWTLHPLQTESVDYVVQRTELLAGLCLFLTLYCSIQAANRDAKPAATAAWSIAAVITCTLGMASKEVMVAAPILVILYDWTFSGEPLRQLIRRRGRFYASLAATWIVLAVLVANSGWRGGSAGFGLGVTSWEYARTQFGFILHYLRLSLWPDALVLDYGNRLATDPAEYVPAGVCVLALVVASLAALASRRFRPLGFLGVWFFAILAPSSSIVPVILQTGAEHRMYLPLAAVVAFVVIAADRLIRGKKEIHFSRWTMPAVTGAALLSSVALALGITTFNRNIDYASTLSIWRDTVEKCPGNWRALCNLGDEYASTGDWKRAIECCDKALRINPQASEAYSNRGAILMRLGNLDGARRDFEQAISANPKSPAAHANFGIARVAAGDFEPAIENFTAAIKLAPASAVFYWHRGSALVRLGRHAAALEDFSEAVRLDPQFDKAWNARADCYRALQQLPEAIADLSRAIEINPRPIYYLNRGIAMGMTGRLQESIDDCSAAIRRDPDLVNAYRTRALSYARLQRYDLARADLSQMQRLGAPPDPRVLEVLKQEARP